MAITVANVVTKARSVLQDTTSVRWPDDELIGWINDAQREIALIKPDASSKNTYMPMIPGTKQSLPNDGLRLLRVVRNMTDASANVGGRAIRLVSREILDAQQPEWHDPEAKGESAFGTIVKHYMYDEADPLHFYVYPGITNAMVLSPMIELIYSANPDDVSQLTDQISIPDLYQNAILNYVLYMAYMKDAEYAGNSQRASSHYQIFTASVTGKGQVDVITTPNLASRSNPNLTASA